MNNIFPWRDKKVTVVCVTIIATIIVMATSYYSWNGNLNRTHAGLQFVSYQRKIEEMSIALLKKQTLEDILPFLTPPVVITTANFGYLQIVNNFLKSIKKVGVNVSIVLVCEDDLLYNHFHNRKDINAVITKFTTNIKKVQKFRTSTFNEIVNRRISHVLQLLNNGLDTFYLDSDTIWLQNPFPYFDEEADLFVQQEKGIPYCSGMFFIRATGPSIRMVTHWEALDKHKYNNQYSYNKAIKETTGLRVKGLPTQKFVGGEIYFKNLIPWSERNPAPVIVHATWRLGPESKIKQLQKCGLWFLNETEMV
ncbi:UDP-D-xylose:L-fucose alpha-1,3-D-xylosyltransferase 3 [Holothuria leucospilota]|uniref:UDP-D-xylose:L-fucose alpha-1,3-D-xylosyltransferase 3 n=1 Tax=Holothuria leucospilota TaxID=206669 RepID=A0A9Q0YIQ5_HOLLE|nr:UDP-D-xylose:L-fucose alpha-1,3-D-xylosyltransferase 3 [Holothuria leucospilota]